MQLWSNRFVLLWHHGVGLLCLLASDKSKLTKSGASVWWIIVLIILVVIVVSIAVLCILLRFCCCRGDIYQRMCHFSLIQPILGSVRPFGKSLVPFPALRVAML